MPNMDGPTMVRHVKELKPDLAVIFMSGYAEEAFRRSDQKAEDIHFLPKPFGLKQLAAKVKEVLSSQPRPAPQKRDIAIGNGRVCLACGPAVSKGFAMRVPAVLLLLPLLAGCTDADWNNLIVSAAVRRRPSGPVATAARALSPAAAAPASLQCLLPGRGPAGRHHQRL